MTTPETLLAEALEVAARADLLDIGLELADDEPGFFPREANAILAHAPLREALVRGLGMTPERDSQAKEPVSGVRSSLAGWVRWTEPMDPVTRLLANLDHESYEVDAVGGGKVRKWKFSEWPPSLQRVVDAARILAAQSPEEPR